jgi:MerR family transcriptional regulator, redox-sensitive transcriptional activator SoxR
MKIGELAQRAQLNASAIRYYERLGLLDAPERAGGQRRYSANALSRLLLIHFASEMGFTLNEIRVFLNGLRDDAPVGPRWKKLARRKIQQVEQSIQRARRLKSLLEHLLDCRCISLQVCVERLSLSPNLRVVRRGALAKLPSSKRSVFK